MTDVDWTDGAPRSRRFDDIYYHPERGLEESRHTFIEGCDLPEAWIGKPLFVVGETGFGTGLNFLATWDAWRQACRPGQRLHFVSVEGFPLARGELQRAHRAFPRLQPLAERLQARYPDPTPGFHRIHFEEDHVILDLLVGEAGDMLTALEARIDAWFLDGFAPSRNPQMWRPEVFAEIGRLSAPDARLATFTAAGAVRRGLQAAGFEIRKAPGFGDKRERAVGRFRGPGPAARLPAWARTEPAVGTPEIVGRGIAGWSLALGFARRGLPFAHTDDGSPRASDLPLALVMPRLTADDSLPGRLFAQSFAFARRTYGELGGWNECGVVQLADDEEMRRRFEKMAAIWSDAQVLSPREATSRAGIALNEAALWLPRAGFVAPDSLPAPDESPTAGAGHEIWANGVGIAQTPAAPVLPIETYRGQLTLLAPSETTAALKTVVVAGHYLSPIHEERHMLGATFDRVDPEAADPGVRDMDHQRNLAAMDQALPTLKLTDSEVIGGRAGIRVALPDRLPAVGPVPDRKAFIEAYAGLRTGGRLPDSPLEPTGWTLAALGARGYTLAPLCAELLISQMLGEPWPLPRDIALLLHPARFLVRGLKRKEI